MVKIVGVECILGWEGGFVDLGMRRCRGNGRKINRVEEKGMRGRKEGRYVMESGKLMEEE